MSIAIHRPLVQMANRDATWRMNLSSEGLQTVYQSPVFVWDLIIPKKDDSHQEIHLAKVEARVGSFALLLPEGKNRRQSYGHPDRLLIGLAAHGWGEPPYIDEVWASGLLTNAELTKAGGDVAKIQEDYKKLSEKWSEISKKEVLSLLDKWNKVAEMFETEVIDGSVTYIHDGLTYFFLLSGENLNLMTTCDGVVTGPPINITGLLDIVLETSGTITLVFEARSYRWQLELQKNSPYIFRGPKFNDLPN